MGTVTWKGGSEQPTQDGALDLLAYGMVSEELARLESKGLIAIFAQTGRRNKSEGKCSLQGRVRWTDENQGISTEHRLDGGNKVLRHDEGIGIATRKRKERSRCGRRSSRESASLVSVSRKPHMLAAS